jgi:stearoyl-CoA desaturase (delta-9 desaturase)
VSRAQRIGNILGVFLPLAGLLAAIVLLWNRFVGVEALLILAAMYIITGAGISVGLHRLFAHRAFAAATPVRATLAVLGTMAMQGPLIRWVANHRAHHAHTDEEGDPHSPHLTPHDGVRGAIAGLWHSHVGWIFELDRVPLERHAGDLLADPVIRFIDRTAAVWVVLGLALPFAAGFVLGGTIEAALIALLWGGPVRIFIVHHATFAINSLCHFTGSKRFETGDESRNVFWLAPLAFGEAWHNNHHAFPTSAFHGLRRWEFDPGRFLIQGLEKLGLVWNVRHPTIEHQRLKLRPRPDAAGSPVALRGRL